MIGEGRGEILTDYSLEGRLDIARHDNDEAGYVNGEVRCDNGCSGSGKEPFEIQVITPAGISVSTAEAYGGKKDGEAITLVVGEGEIIASGWSGYTTWVLTDNGTLTFTPSEQKLEDGQTNLKNYWKVNGVLTLPWSAYADRITKVVIEEGIHDIGQMAFYELPNLVEVQLPASAVEIRGYAFKNCKKLTTINLEVVEYIREGAFYGCTALETVDLADGVVIEDWAFTKVPGYKAQ